MNDGIINLFSSTNISIGAEGRSTSFGQQSNSNREPRSAVTLPTKTPAGEDSTKTEIIPHGQLSDLQQQDESISISIKEGNGSAQEATPESATGEADGSLSYQEVLNSLGEDFEANDTRIAMIGNVDSGKSTLIGVLTNPSALDDGRGSARSMVLKHRHEQENGRTSAVTVEIMGYKGKEQVLPSARNHCTALGRGYGEERPQCHSH